MHCYWPEAREGKTRSETHADGHEIEWTNGHGLDQGNSLLTRFGDHQDTGEQYAKRGTQDRKIVYTVTVQLDESGPTSMRIVGEADVHYEGVGSGFVFPSALWHRTVAAEEGVWKLTFFFGYFL